VQEKTTRKASLSKHFVVTIFFFFADELLSSRPVHGMHCITMPGREDADVGGLNIAVNSWYYANRSIIKTPSWSFPSFLMGYLLWLPNSVVICFTWFSGHWGSRFIRTSLEVAEQPVGLMASVYINISVCFSLFRQYNGMLQISLRHDTSNASIQSDSCLVKCSAPLSKQRETKLQRCMRRRAWNCRAFLWRHQYASSDNA